MTTPTIPTAAVPAAAGCGMNLVVAELASRIDAARTARADADADPAGSFEPAHRRRCQLALAIAHDALRAHTHPGRAELRAALNRLPGARDANLRAAALRRAERVLENLPRGARLCDDLVGLALAALTEREAALQLAALPRLFVTDTAGRTFALETRPSAGPAADAWLASRVDAHRALGRHMPRFSGVLVTAPDCGGDVDEEHVTETGAAHRLGGCHACEMAVTR
jgi:hypothetical protein